MIFPQIITSYILSFFSSWKCFPSAVASFCFYLTMCPLPFPPNCGRAEDGQAERERQKGWGGGGGMSQGSVGYVKMTGCCFCCLSISAVLVGGVGVDRGAVWLLAIFARRHPLVYPVQAARLLEVTNLPRGREALNG